MEGQGAPNTEEGHGEGDEASDSIVATSSGTAKAENSCQEVRGPVNLEESGPNTSEMQYTDTIREDATLKKQSDNRQEISNDQQPKVDENIVVENKQGSSCDSAASLTLSSGATVVANSSSSESQQKQLETRGPQGSVSNKGDSGTSQVSHTEAHSFLFSLFFRDLGSLVSSGQYKATMKTARKDNKRCLRLQRNKMVDPAYYRLKSYKMSLLVTDLV